MHTAKVGYWVVSDWVMGTMVTPQDEQRPLADERPKAAGKSAQPPEASGGTSTGQPRKSC